MEYLDDELLAELTVLEKWGGVVRVFHEDGGRALDGNKLRPGCTTITAWDSPAWKSVASGQTGCDCLSNNKY